MMSLLIRNLVFTVVVPGRGGPIPVVRLELRHGRAWHPGSVGRAAPRGRARPLPLGTQPHLPRRAAGRAGGGGPVRLAAAAGLRGRAGGLLPPVRHWLRGAGAAPPLRTRLPGVPARGPALDPAPPVLSRASLRGRGHDRR